MNLLKKIEQSRDFWFLLIASVCFFLLRFPSLFEPYWYGDEGIYEVIGTAINHGRFLYRDIWDNKPPLLYMIYAFFNGDQFFVRAFSLLFGIGALIAFYFLAKKLLQKSEKIVFLTTGIFGLFFAIPFIEGNIANSENFMLFPILASGLVVYISTTQKENKPFSSKLLLAGFILGLSLLLKVVAVFDFAAFTTFLFFYYITHTTTIKEILRRLFSFWIGFGIPMLTTLIFFLFHGILGDFITAAFRQNVGYVGYGNSFIIPQGFLLLKLFILGIFLLGLLFKHKLLSWQQLFVVIWFAFSLFNAFFSQRPYTHYVLVILPSLCLLVGTTLAAVGQNLKIFFCALVLMAIFLLNRNFSFYQKTIPYYQNYLSFIANKKDLSSYQAFFDARTPSDYAVAWYIKPHLKKDDTVFIWGNNGQLYKLLDTLPPGRYIVAYHMTASKQSLQETQSAFEKEKPTFLIVSNDQPFPFSLSGYKQQMTMYNLTIYERTF